MNDADLLSTGQLARHCRVTPKTVNNWIQGGKLTAYTTAGGHHRIRVRELREFLKQAGLPPLPDEEPRPGPTKVLVVDDDEEVVVVLTRLLERWGYAVSSALNGFNAGLEVGRFAPDLILLDLMMPFVDGFTVCREVKGNPATAHIKVLILTGFTEPGFVDQAQACGADGWMAKPIQAAELKKRIQALVAATQQ